jgi:outer membrane protein assembly factor BamD
MLHDRRREIPFGVFAKGLRLRNSPYSLVFCLLIGCLAVSCGPRTVPMNLDAEDTYEWAEEAFADGHFLSAMEAYRTVLSSFPLSPYSDSSQYGLAECYFAIEDFTMARAEYERLIQQFPESDLVDDAYYKIGVSYLKDSLPPQLDQTMTGKAREQFENFVELYPDSPLVSAARLKLLETLDKLAEKDFRNGELYLKLGYGDAAIVYFQKILEQFPETGWAPYAQLGIGIAHEEEERYGEAVAEYRRVKLVYAESDAAREADERLRRLEAMLREG